MKKIALIGTFDTKKEELYFVKNRLEKEQIRVITIDVATMPGYVSNENFPPSEVFKAANKTIQQITKLKKHEMLHEAAVGSERILRTLYQKGEIQGAMSLGGLQNSNMACFAMKALPVGIPKIMVSTVASGQRVFEPMTGTKDITIMPAVADFIGVNIVSYAVLSNAIAAMVGMLKNAGNPIESGRKAIGVTFMGATNDGAVNAIDVLKRSGYEVVAFHSTGAGGRAMENMIDDGIITASLDITLHEVVYEYFGYGFGYGANNRVLKGAEKGIPMIVTPGGIDFMCQWKWQLFDDIDSRIYNWHNETLAHVKLWPKEAVDISRMIIDRINQATGNVEVVIPTKGLRSFTRKGEELYAPDVDEAIIQTFEKYLRKDIPLKKFDGNFCDLSFSEYIANEMISILEK